MLISISLNNDVVPSIAAASNLLTANSSSSSESVQKQRLPIHMRKGPDGSRYGDFSAASGQ